MFVVNTNTKVFLLFGSRVVCCNLTLSFRPLLFFFLFECEL